MLVALVKISDLENWKLNKNPGTVLNTQCFDARYLYKYWANLETEIINPNDRGFVDNVAALYVKNLVENLPELTNEEEEDYFRVDSKVTSPTSVKTTFNLENVYNYSEKYMDDWLKSFGLKYDTIAEKRYMTISKLMEYNLLDNYDKSLVLKHMNNFLSLLEYYPTSAAILRQHLN